MDFDLPESANAVREGVRAIAERYDQEYWDRCDAEKRWPEEVWQELVKGGWTALAIPEEYGGAGQGLLELAVALENLAAGGAGGAATFMYLLTPAFGGLTIARHGTEAQRREFLPKIAAGELETCFAITEPDAGSNSINISTHAVRDGDHFLVRGQKIWISGVERADYMVLVTRTIPAAEARPRTSGFTVLLVDIKEAVAAGTLTYQPIPKLGTNTVASNMVFLDDVRVPADRVLGEVDQGFAVLWDILNPERILAAAGGVGSAELTLKIACDYARERAPFGKPIGANQAVAFPLARIKAQVELARLMTYKAAWLWDRHRPCGAEANIAKLTAADAAWQAADRAFQVHGGMAYSLEYPVARFFRDARIAKNIPVAEELVLAHIAQHELGLPKSY
ncbi:acyl-CoA dehydrogenase family protein [Thermomonospora curvata]|uniref:Acyl-CoA dehydrogenase domain protein n=1 Tax=Thermomonospora curvata (strain ATCC 19995 / DSM 43183 / JCM 3096 / KCTC 9072 / NBRC 15933 / NCIMB 10081 / Henssen B9) TaxID=471852 RepID=D1A3X1_THECD|nr:acyl-CoA dehydrogenase family protein [Thermomonospora curvata]ACY98024.1 acyl-CoA dehydrogenase domain protein [Thermomonospora curvata DSM 43183]